MLKLNQFVTITPEIQQLIIKLKGYQTAFNLIKPNQVTLANLRKKSILLNALYSARIEGNRLTEETLRHSANKLQKLEVQNLLDAYTWLFRQEKVVVTNELIINLHRLAMANLRSDAGILRTEQTAIFNSAGVAIYLTPPANDVKPLLTTWINQAQNSEIPTFTQSCIAHYQFEKIHPFVDGNGRVGRLLFSAQLQSDDFRLINLLGLEKLIEATRDEYYYHLSNESRDVTNFTSYLLKLIAQASDDAFVTLSTSHDHASSSLLPRRAELLAIISDHAPCSADFLYRRFMAVPRSTIRYDLKQLQGLGLIKKLGTTRGALYQPS